MGSTVNPLRSRASPFPPITRTSPGLRTGGWNGRRLYTVLLRRFFTEPVSAKIQTGSLHSSEYKE